MDAFMKRINCYRKEKTFYLIDGDRLKKCSVVVGDNELFITSRRKQIRISFVNIVEIRQGFKTDRWLNYVAKLRRKNNHQLKDQGSLSIVCFNFDSLFLPLTFDLYGESESNQNLLQQLAHKLQKQKLNQQEIFNSLLKQFYLTQVQDNHLTSIFSNVDRLSKFFKHINLQVDSNNLQKILRSYKISNNNRICIESFLKLMTDIDTRPYFNFLFYKYSLFQSELMFIEGLKKFLIEEQFEDQFNLTNDQCQKLMKQFGKNIGSDEEPYLVLTRNCFYRLMENERFNIFDSKHQEVCQDMSQPLTHYFIASSHNSYLSGNQLSSSSSYEMYRQIILGGCRCVEIDVWDDDNENQPVVYHGYTMTSKILLEGVLQTINDVAFVNSQYPIIISVENQCKNPKNQIRMAELMKKIFKDRLFIGTVQEDCFPSPEQLKQKIFIKGSKKLDALYHHETDQIERISFGFFELFYFSSKAKRRQLDSIRRQRNFNQQFSRIIIDNDVEEDDEINLKQARSFIAFKRFQLKNSLDSKIKDDEKPFSSTSVDSLKSFNQIDGLSLTKKNFVDKSFSKLINYFETKKFESIEHCLEHFEFYQMISLNEKSSKELTENKLKDYRSFSQKNMVRIYPAGWRQDSSNYSPLDHWNAGAQMVALNYQRHSVPMFLNQALFSLNGTCGYVLKPSYLIESQPSNFIKNHKSEQNLTFQLNIQVICGQFWNHFGGSDFCFISKRGKNRINLKVIIKVYSPKKKFCQITKSIKHNGFNPVWNEKFPFLIENPELTFIHFTLTNNDLFFGQHLISFSAVCRGFRHIGLFDRHNRPLTNAKLFLHVDYSLE